MIETEHKIYFSNSQRMAEVPDNSVNLIVTSPPYPMIAMWDNLIGDIESNPMSAYERFHNELDKVWNECYRVLSDSGILCINIGDATRNINGDFRLYSNHCRITDYCEGIGLTSLPCIIWSKPTNSPNKFMGSGMLPCNAYVTLEHEYILIFRKGNKRKPDKERGESAIFFEERNQWYSDIWRVVGTSQTIGDKRSAAYPFEIPYRLINMFSQYGDVVLDPFVGTGTTAMATARNSIGYEINKELLPVIKKRFRAFSYSDFDDINKRRLARHKDFIEKRKKEGKTVKFYNVELKVDVVSKQETKIKLHPMKTFCLYSNGNVFCAYD